MTYADKRRAAAAAICWLALTIPAVAQQAPTSAKTATILVTVKDVMAPTGQIRGSLCSDPGKFAKAPCSMASASAPAREGSVELQFTGVSAGTYALLVYHDEDDNGRFDLMSEPMAFGNGSMELPPALDKAALNVTGDLRTETSLLEMMPPGAS